MITIVTEGDDRIVEQIIKQLNKVVEVMKVTDLTEADHLDRETALIKINTNTKPGHRDEAVRICDIFRAKIVDVQPKSLTIEVTGDESKVEKLLSLMKNFGITDLTRTGKVAMPRS